MTENIKRMYSQFIVYQNSLPVSLAQISLLGILILGIGFRLVWGGDIEYKVDETFNFSVATNFGIFRNFGSARTLPTVGSVFHLDIPIIGSWPAAGEMSGLLLPNPGFGLWAFACLAWIFQAETPEQLARTVQICNSLALILFLYIGWKKVKGSDRESWLWAFALGAVNPIDILFQRKIWLQSLLPVFTMLMTVAWWQKEKKWGAFVYGLMGALLGQLHMSGFIFAFSWLICTFIWRRKETHWKGWFFGSCVGAIPLIPWLGYILEHLEAFNQVSPYFDWYLDFAKKYHPLSSWMNYRPVQYWLIWMSSQLGLGLDYAFRHEIKLFFAWPWIGDPQSGTFLMLGIHLLLFGIAVFVVTSSGFEFVKKIRTIGINRIWRQWVGLQENTGIVLMAGFGMYGILLSASPIYVHRHYLIIAFPFVHLAMVKLILFATRFSLFWSRSLLLVLVILQASLSCGLLSYVHSQGGIRYGDYGVALSHQDRKD